MVSSLRPDEIHLVDNSLRSAFPIKSVINIKIDFFPLAYSRKVCLGKDGDLAPEGQQGIALTNGDPAHRRVTRPQ